MKLLYKYNRINYLVMMIIFIIASCSIYFLIKFVLVSQVDDDILSQQKEVNAYLSKLNEPPDSVHTFNQRLIYKRIYLPLDSYYNTAVFPIPNTEKVNIYRQLNYTANLNGNYYEITIGKSLVATLGLLKSILGITIGTILLITLVNLLINRVVIKNLWKPFYTTLKQVGNFKLGQGKTLVLQIGDIDEFSYMNQVLENSINKAENDYILLREFTENASHELQTPLAIIRSKIDLLIQVKNLTEEQTQFLLTAYSSIKRLTHLNKSLLLLTKIENNQFQEKMKIDLKQKVEEKLVQFGELLAGKNLGVETNLKNIEISINEELADLLFDNLLSNSIRHNYEGGHIFIGNRPDNTLIIKNTGNGEGLDQTRIFSRFYKSKQSNNSTGLGLAIVKQICEISDCKISYDYINNDHVFFIQWNNSKK